MKVIVEDTKAPLFLGKYKDDTNIKGFDLSTEEGLTDFALFFFRRGDKRK